MSKSDNALRRRIREHAASMNMKTGREAIASSVRSLTTQVLSGWGAYSSPQGGAFGLESLVGEMPTRNKAFDALRDADPAVMMQGLQKLGMSPRHIEQVTEDCIRLYDPSVTDRGAALRAVAPQDGKTYAPLSVVVGRTAAGELANFNDGIGQEAFGDDVNRLNTDDRLTMDLMIMRPWDNIMDKALARVSDSSPVVTIRVPSPEAWDWATTQQANSTSASRNGSSNTYRLRDLYRNPTPVNSQPKRIAAITANDANGVLWNNTSASYYKTDKAVSLLDLSRNAAVFTYDKVDRTDLVADGGLIDNAIVAITDPHSGSPVTEYFLLPCRSFDLAMFVISPSNKASGQRQVMMSAVLPLTSATTQWDGSASTICGHLTDAKIQVNVQINARLNIQTGELQAGGPVTLELKGIGGAAVSNATQTYFGTLTAALAAYSVELYFDEENQRKANLAVWVQYYETQFVVPRSRIYFTEYSLTQDVDENAVAATSSVVALGNGRRGLNIVVNALSDIGASLQFVSANPEIAAANALDEQSFAAALVKPTVVTTTMDFSTEELNTMNESTRLTEIHGRFRARFLSMVTQLFAKSLMLNQYKGGEVPVIKAWVHSTIADLVIGIMDYHPDLQDRNTTATGADYSMTLPNGYRLDVIKSNLDCLQQRIYAVPVIESDMASILSAASIRDCGTVTTNYTPTNGGSVVRRVATSTREIVMMSNKVGVCMIVSGLSAQLGTFNYTPVQLNQDYSDSLAV